MRSLEASLLAFLALSGYASAAFVPSQLSLFDKDPHHGVTDPMEFDQGVFKLCHRRNACSNDNQPVENQAVRPGAGFHLWDYEGWSTDGPLYAPDYLAATGFVYPGREGFRRYARFKGEHPDEEDAYHGIIRLSLMVSDAYIDSNRLGLRIMPENTTLYATDQNTNAYERIRFHRVACPVEE
ncbi:hypothetical protein BDV25DRAFT_138850 [Aspergillus avenaceus]|uniref:Uncharacterized protein n=1 Tax=Aspergillus avenaceus TaxID=36643 RepID=A0A5N6TYM1_ASPAV|nr:hypothetical protein BDV25DRAFT_138850 [Aspergillus avenaceus]